MLYSIYQSQIVSIYRKSVINEVWRISGGKRGNNFKIKAQNALNK